jgi:hypothetical protein
VSLLSCPFCNELFASGERKKCPVCGIPLVPFESLPTSDSSDEDDMPRKPEWEPLGSTFLGRGRGALAALALAGLAAFFLPWVHVTLPDVVTYTGSDIARRIGWVWGAAVGWFTMLPTVLSRQSVMQMRGARVAVSFLAAVPGVTVLVLCAQPPHAAHGVPLRFSFEWGLYATLALSVAAVAFGLLFGGRVEEIAAHRETSAGQIVH